MKRVIVYGGQGGLGKVLVSHLKQKGYWIVSGMIHYFICTYMVSAESPEAEFLVHFEFWHRLLFRNQCRDWHQLGWQWVYPLPTRNRVSIDLWRLLNEKSTPRLIINNFGTMGNSLPALFSESTPALLIRLKIPPLKLPEVVGSSQRPLKVSIN